MRAPTRIKDLALDPEDIEAFAACWPTITHHKARVFLAALAVTGQRGQAADMAGIKLTTALAYRYTMEGFPEAMETAMEISVWAQEDEARYRSLFGHEDPKSADLLKTILTAYNKRYRAGAASGASDEPQATIIVRGPEPPEGSPGPSEGF